MSDGTWVLKLFCVVIMWPLVFICMLTVGGVPINSTQEATSHSPDNVTVTSMLGVLQPATTEALKGTVALKLDPPQRASAEALQEFQEDMIVQEGDIIIPEDRNAVESLWADATVPYIISDELADRQPYINAAFKMITDFTCIRFQKRTTEFNYLMFINGIGCASSVGCQGGPQPVYYSSDCSVGNVCHEIIHSLGLHHEHTRRDRDQYITVQWQNIMPGKENDFSIKYGNTLNLPYDLDSIMHYGRYFFSTNGMPTLLPKHGGEQMGQRTHLSQLDIKRLNRLYHCDERMKRLSGLAV